jgi:hypothetical protein
MDLEVKTEPDARVSVEVANKTFGPQKASPQGLAVVPIEVPPGVATARALADSESHSTALEVALPTPPSAGLSGSLLPQPLTAGRSGWLWMIHPSKLDPASLEISARGASVVPLRRADDRTLFEVRPQPGADRVEIEAAIKNAPASRIQFASEITPEPPPTAPVAPPPPATPSPLYPGLMGAGLVGSGPVAGMQLALQLGYRLPTSAFESAAELEVGLRAMGLKPGVFVGGAPLLLAFRARAYSSPKWAIDGKVGVGLFAFFHREREPGEESSFETGFASDLHLAGQLAMKQEGAEIFLELRGFALPLRSRVLSEDLYGAMVGIGIR